MILKTNSKEFMISIFRPFCFPIKAPITKKNHLVHLFRKNLLSYLVELHLLELFLWSSAQIHSLLQVDVKNM